MRHPLGDDQREIGLAGAQDGEIDASMRIWKAALRRTELSNIDAHNALSAIVNRPPPPPSQGDTPAAALEPPKIEAEPSG